MKFGRGEKICNSWSNDRKSICPVRDHCRLHMYISKLSAGQYIEAYDPITHQMYACLMPNHTHVPTIRRKKNIQTQGQCEIIQINVYACAPTADDKLGNQKQSLMRCEGVQRARKSFAHTNSVAAIKLSQRQGQQPAGK